MNMHRLIPAGLVAIAAATVPAAIQAPASAAGSRSVERLRFVERQVSEHLVDTGRRGLSAGDRNMIRSQLLDRSGRPVGRADFDCAVTDTGANLGGVCHGALTLPGGQLIGEFAWDRSGSSRFQAITGGTRQYEGARGQVIVDTSGSDSREPFVIELVR